MIFPDVSITDWLKKYPELKVLETKCDGCGDSRKTTKPFLIRGCAGLTTEKCPCGNAKTASSTMVTTTEEEFKKWENILGHFRANNDQS